MAAPFSVLRQNILSYSDTPPNPIFNPLARHRDSIIRVYPNHTVYTIFPSIILIRATVIFYLDTAVAS